jgi:hypothetical protein
MNNYSDFTHHQDAPTISALIVKLEQLKADSPGVYHGDRYERYVSQVLQQSIINHLSEKFDVAASQMP